MIRKTFCFSLLLPQIYPMKKYNVLLMLLLFVAEVSAQSDIVIAKRDSIFYRNESGFIVKTHRNKAEGYGLLETMNPNIYVHKIYYLHTENLMAAYEVYDKPSANNKNNVSATLPIKNGIYEEWYNSGEKKINCFYTENKLNGEFKVFHKNGKLKRLELWQNGEWQNGECFDEHGNKIQYCSYQELAEYNGGLPELYKFIGQTLVYPKEALNNDIQGVVYVSFIIDTDGSITNAKIIKSVHKQLDNEALRIVNEMPKWKPTKFEGEFVQTEFALPINFRIE